MKETLKNLDLRNQLNSELKSKWYYQNIKHGLKINKQSVKFDDSFTFKLRYEKPLFEGDYDSIEVDYYINGEKEKSLGYFNKEDRYSDGSEDEILKNILVYIANYI